MEESIMNRLVLPLKASRSRLIPILNSFSRDSEVRAYLSESEQAEAEESFKVYCKPVELYNILQRGAEKKASFLRRSLHYKLQAKNQRRIQVSISVRGTISDGVQTPNLFPLYIVLARPVSTPNGETQQSSSYRFKKACKLITCIEDQTVSSAQTKFILPEINKLSTEVESGSIAMLLVSCADINNSEEIDLTKPHTFSPSYEGYSLFGKIPIDFLRLSSERSPNLSLGERVEVLSTVTMQSCYMKSSCSGEDKSLSFLYPNNSEAVSISQQVPITMTAEELGAKDKSAYDLYSYNNAPTDSPTPVMRLRAGNVVFFYRYYNNLLQKSEVTEDYSCPFCLSKCGSYNGLKCHLTASHDLLRYEFRVDEDYQIVIVYARANSNSDEIFDSVVGPKQNFHFCHRPMRRQIQNANHVGALVLNSNMATVPVEMRGNCERMECDVNNPNATPVSGDAAITSMGPESADLSVPESNITSLTLPESTKTKKLSVEQSVTRNQMLLHKRQFYHSHTAQPMTWEQVIAEEDSEDDVDEDVADIEDRILLDDCMDVNQHEKQIMHLWNSLIRKQRVLSDSHIPWACEVFSNLHGEDLVQTPQLLMCWNLFMVKLWKNNLIDQKTVNYCLEIVDKYRLQVPDQDI